MRIERRLLGGVDGDLACARLVWYEDGATAVFTSQTTVTPNETLASLGLCFSALVRSAASVATRDDGQRQRESGDKSRRTVAERRAVLVLVESGRETGIEVVEELGEAL